MDNLEHITTHSTDEARRLIDHFKGGNFETLVEGLGDRWQTLENDLWNMIQGRYIANATGEALQSIGSDVGVTALYTDDNTYRVFVYAKIAENRSNGTRTDLYNILSLLGLGDIKIYDVYPAALTVNYTPNTLTMTCACIRSILESASDPIELDIVQHSGTPFGFLGDSGAFGFGVGELGESA